MSKSTKKTNAAKKAVNKTSNADKTAKNASHKAENTKKLIVAAIVAVLVVILAVAGVLIAKNAGQKAEDAKPGIIAFYGLDQKYADALRTVISSAFDPAASRTESASETDSSADAANSPAVPQYTFQDLDTSVPLVEHLQQNPRITLVFAWKGEGLEAAVKKADSGCIPVAAPVFEQLPMSVQLVSGPEVPLLANHFEAAVRAKTFAAGSMNELLAFAESEVQNKKFASDFPMAVAGGNDDTLLMLASALYESRFGSDSYRAFYAELAERAAKAKTAEEGAKIFDALNYDKSSARDFFPVLDELVFWREQGFLNENWINFSEKVVETLMDDAIADIVFMSLQQHRTVPYQFLKYYSENFMPSGLLNNAQTNGQRSLIIPMIEGLGLTNRIEERNALTKQILEHLLSNSVQTRLSELTGLAPLASRAECFDEQAFNVRFYAAASEEPLCDLGKLFITSEAKSGFAKSLRTYLSR
ncbi:MAG: hypothetical protein MJ183_10895 [Treponemataceae bacterium]|nr:hypothetical protein [Treponemataceae bacterium]